MNILQNRAKQRTQGLDISIEKSQELLQFFSEFLNETMESIGSIKKSVYDLLNVKIPDQSRYKIQTQSKSILAGTKIIMQDLHRVETMLKGYIVDKKTAQIQRVNRAITEKPIPDVYEVTKSLSPPKPPAIARRYNSPNEHYSKLKQQNNSLAKQLHSIEKQIVDTIITSSRSTKTNINNKNISDNRFNYKTYKNRHVTETYINKQQRLKLKQSIKKRNRQCLQLIKSLLQQAQPESHIQKNQKKMLLGTQSNKILKGPSGNNV